MSPDPTTFPVFTYGTLRPGQGNARIITPDVVPGAAPLTVTLPGYRLYANQSRTYPYLMATDLPGGTPVTGTLYLIRDGRAFQRARQMELGAGYDESLVTVTLPDGREMQAIAWTLNPSRAGWCGDLITSGDWCEWEQHNVPDWAGGFAARG